MFGFGMTFFFSERCFSIIDKHNELKYYSIKKCCDAHMVNVADNGSEDKWINTYLWNVKVMTDVMKKVISIKVSMVMI